MRERWWSGKTSRRAVWLTGFMVYSTSRRVHREAYNIVSSLRFGLTAWVSGDVPWCMTRCRVPIRRASMKAGSVLDVKYRRFGMKRSARIEPSCVHVSRWGPPIAPLWTITFNSIRKWTVLQPANNVHAFCVNITKILHYWLTMFVRCGIKEVNEIYILRIVLILQKYYIIN